MHKSAHHPAYVGPPAPSDVKRMKRPDEGCFWPSEREVCDGFGLEQLAPGACKGCAVPACLQPQRMAPSSQGWGRDALGEVDLEYMRSSVAALA